MTACNTPVVVCRAALLVEVKGHVLQLRIPLDGPVARHLAAKLVRQGALAAVLVHQVDAGSGLAAGL